MISSETRTDLITMKEKEIEQDIVVCSFLCFLRRFAAKEANTACETRREGPALPSTGRARPPCVPPG